MAGADLVEVDALSRPSQNPHDVELRPSLMAKLRRADVSITNGLELDIWADQLARGSNNPHVMVGGPRPDRCLHRSTCPRGAGDPRGPLDGRRAPAEESALLPGSPDDGDRDGQYHYGTCPGGRPSTAPPSNRTAKRSSPASGSVQSLGEGAGAFKGTRVVVFHN